MTEISLATPMIANQNSQGNYLELNEESSSKILLIQSNNNMGKKFKSLNNKKKLIRI